MSRMAGVGSDAGVCWHACPVFVFMVFPFAECLFTPSDEGFSALRVSCCGRLRYDVCVEELNQQKVKSNDRKPLFWKEKTRETTTEHHHEQSTQLRLEGGGWRR